MPTLAPSPSQPSRRRRAACPAVSGLLAFAVALSAAAAAEAASAPAAVAAALLPAATAESSTPALAWNQFRGPGRDGRLPADPGLAARWPESGPRELWRRPLGAGFATVLAAGDWAWTAAAEGEEEVLLAFDAATGEPRWRTVIGTPTRSEFGDGPRATPFLDLAPAATTAGGRNPRLYTVTSTSRLVAVDAHTGAKLWEQDLTAYDPVPRFGYATSPVVVDGMVIVDVGTKDLVDRARAEAEAKLAAAGGAAAPAAAGEQPDSEAPDGAPPATEPPAFPPPVGSLAAFDAATGELRWRGGFPGPAGYSSPVLLTLGGVRQLVYSRGTQLAGLSLTDGSVLWRHPIDPRSAIAMPVPLGDDVLFTSASDDHAGGLAVRVTRQGDGSWQTATVWSERLMRNHFNSSVAVGDGVYGFDNGTFRCLDRATGAKRWAQRGFGKGSLIAAGELLYVLGDDGTLALVEASCEEYRERGRVQAMRGKTWTSPTLAGGRLFLRDHDEIVAYDVRSAALTGTARGPVAASAATGTTAATPAASTAVEQALAGAEALTVDQILARYATARGGHARWQAVKSLELGGRYRAFSEGSDFTLVRQRGNGQDLYRLDYRLPAGAAVRAVDPAAGPWLAHPFLTPDPLVVASIPDLAPYRYQMLREARFAPLLLDASALGLTIEKAGRGEINGRPTLMLQVRFPAPAADTPAPAVPTEETWHLDPQTFLEVAVDSQVVDFTQGPNPFLQRAYYADFRTVDGLVLPFRYDLEFNARYEAMEVATARVDGPIDPARFTAPPPPPPPPAGEAAN
jgi:outer membrane protein assembly factor BamB